jgi:hypothetical protein
VQVLGGVTQRGELDVEISDLAESGSQPLELVAQALGLARDEGSEEPQSGAQPPGGNPHLVNVFGVAAVADTLFVVVQGVHVLAQRGTRKLSD